MLESAFGLLLSGFVTFFLYVSLLLYSNFSLKKEKRNSFLNSYGYEFYANCNLPIKVSLYALLSMSAVLITSGETIFLTSGKVSYYSIIMAITFTLSFFCLVAGNIIPLSHPKTHLIFSSLGFFVFCFSCFIYLFSITNVLRNLTSKANYNDVIAIFVGIIGILSFAALFNPRLKNWIKMERSEVDGKIVYVKPKINFLPLYEWCYLILMVLVAVLFFINVILAKQITIRR